MAQSCEDDVVGRVEDLDLVLGVQCVEAVVAQRSDGEEGALQVGEDVGTASVARQVWERQESSVCGLDGATVRQRNADANVVRCDLVESVGISEGDEMAGGSCVCVDECVCVCRRQGSECIMSID